MRNRPASARAASTGADIRRWRSPSSAYSRTNGCSERATSTTSMRVNVVAAAPWRPLGSLPLEPPAGVAVRALAEAVGHGGRHRVDVRRATPVVEGAVGHVVVPLSAVLGLPRRRQLPEPG